MPVSPRRRTLAAVKAEKRKRMLMVAHNHPQAFPGGAEIFAYDLFKALRTHTHYAPMFMAAAHDRSPHTSTAFMAANDGADEVLFAGGGYDYFYHSQRHARSLYHDFRALLKDVQPHVIHFHHSLRIGLEALRVARDTLPQAKIVYTLHEFLLMCHREGQMLKTGGSLCDKAGPEACHGCFPQFTASQFFMREAFIKAHLALVDQFIAPSEFLAARFVEWGIPAGKIRVMENGRHIHGAATHRALAKGGTRSRFAYFGQINPFKGALLLMQAAGRLAAEGFSDFHIDIYGNVELQEEAFKQSFFTALREHAGHVTFHGKYDNAALPQLIADADWVVVPSLWWENSPLVIQEAFMHQRPVICSNIGGMKEKVADGVNGLHFAAGNEAGLAAALRRAATDKKLWAKLVKNITPRLSIEQCARDHAALYDALA